MRRRLFWLLAGTLVGVIASVLTERRIRRVAVRLATAPLRRSLVARPAEAVERLRRLGKGWTDAGHTDLRPTLGRFRPLGHVPARRYPYRPVR